MRLPVILLVIILLPAIGTWCAAVETPANQEQVEKILVEGNNAFAVDLFTRLRDREGNLFFSPSSLSIALGMTYTGAAGQTAEEMAKVLHFSGHSDQVSADFAKLVKALEGTGSKRPYQLDIANALWGAKGYEFLPQFIRTIAEYYSGTFQPVDFKGNVEQARRTINAWVEEHTQNKIRDLLQPGVLDPETRLVLTNAIYFKGNWVKPFKEVRTQKAEFFATADKKSAVPFMHQTGHFPYLERENFQALKLPYEGELSLVTFLPKKIDGLHELEKSLTARNLETLLKRFSARDVQVSFPKFKMTSQFELKPVLTQMGMGRAFSTEADFSKLTRSERLFLSAVVHKAYVDVNEKGTEAAAATGVIAMPTAVPMPSRPIVFKADHPFLFLIRDDRTGTILFMGRLAEPSP
jgi:serpin B